MLEGYSCIQKPPDLSSAFFNPCKPWARRAAKKSWCVSSDSLPRQRAAPGAGQWKALGCRHEDDAGSGESRALAPQPPKCSHFCWLNRCQLLRGIMCHRACWLRRLIISSNSLAFRLASQRAYQECCHPCVAICPHLGFPVPKEVAPQHIPSSTSSGLHPADQQVLPSSPGRALVKPRRYLQQKLRRRSSSSKSAQHPNSSLPEIPSPAAGY